MAKSKVKVGIFMAERGFYIQCKALYDGQGELISRTCYFIDWVSITSKFTLE